jgi:hypothetical protein
MKKKKKSFLKKNRNLLIAGMIFFVIILFLFFQPTEPVYLLGSDIIIGHANNLDNATIICNSQSVYPNGAHAITSERGYECILAVAPFQ